MNKKIVIIISTIVLMVVLITSLLCYYLIPRIIYKYDEKSNSYYVEYVFGNAKEYTILDEYNGKEVTYIASRVFENKKSVEKIILGKNITKIEKLAFNGCSKLEFINLENVLQIERNAFENCLSLNKIDIYVKDILGGTFIGCTNLEVVNLYNTNSIGSLAFAFTNIRTISIPNTTKILENDVFYECNNLRQINVYSKYLLNNDYLNSLKGVIFIS